MNVPHIVNELKRASIPLEDKRWLDELVEAAGQADYVLLGEASHGTSEFYKLRADITERLIRDKGFSFVAVEGDWPPCFALNRYVKRLQGGTEPDRIEESSAAGLLAGQFGRWPEWMWANEETAAFLERLRSCNDTNPERRKAGFYGLDVYSLWESLDEIIQYLNASQSPDLAKALQAFECFEPYRKDEQSYGVSSAFFRETCEDEAIELLKAMQKRRQYAGEDDEESLAAELNALVAVDAEHYYHQMVQGGPESWNVRDRHMAEVLERLMTFHGHGAKAVIWAHNTHIGDARFTDMKEDGMINIGQLLRERHGRVFAVGFGTYEGTVMAGKEWGAVPETMTLPKAVENSWDELMHRAGGDAMFMFPQGGASPLLRTVLGQRAVGVVYRPQFEQYGNYVPTSLSRRYDAYVFVDRTTAVRPLAHAPAFV